MAYRYNSATGQLEDEQGQPAPVGTPIPVDQMQPAAGPSPIAPGALAAAQRSGVPVNEPVVLDRRTPDEQQAAASMQPPSVVAPPPTVAAPALPAVVKTGSQTTVSREKLAPGETEAEQKREGLAAEDQKLAGLQLDVETKAAGEKAKGAKEEAALGAQHIERQQAVIAAGQKAIETANQRFASESEKLSKMQPRDYYEGRSGLRIWNAVMMGLGELGAGLARTGHNLAADVIQSQIQHYYTMEREKIERQRETVASAKEGVAIARQDKADKLADLQVDMLARSAALKQSIEARVAEVGTEHARVFGKRMLNALEQEDLKIKRDWLTGQRAKISSTSTYQATDGAAGGGRGQSGTAEQQKLGLYARDMMRDLETIRQNPQLTGDVLAKIQKNQLASESADKRSGEGLFAAAGVGAGRMVGLIPKSKYDNLTPEHQSVVNAWDNAVENFVRMKTGAGMPVEEARREALQNAPSAGDSPLVIAQKFRRLQSAAADMLAASGPAGVAIQARAGAPAGVAPTPAPAKPAAHDKRAVQWARLHPKDPRAQEILAANGM